MEKSGRLDQENAAIVDDAVRSMAVRNPPKVWLANPEYDGLNYPIGPGVEYFRLKKALFDAGLAFSPLAEPDYEIDLLYEHLNVVAAKRGLVTIEKELPRHYKELTPAERLLVASVRQPKHEQLKGLYCARVDGNDGLQPAPEGWVDEDTVVLLGYEHYEYRPHQTGSFLRFLPKDKVGPQHLPLIEHFLGASGAFPMTEPGDLFYDVDLAMQPANVRMAAEVLYYVDELHGGGSFEPR